MWWTLVGIFSGAVCILVGIFLGVAICEYKKETDGFQLLAKEIDKLVQAQNGKIQRRGCGECSYMATGEVLQNVVQELRHHVMTRHPEVVSAASNPVHS